MRKLTAIEQWERVKEVFGDALTMYLETYTGSLSKPHFKCNECGYEFDRRIDDLLHGQNGEPRGCSMCGNGKVKNRNDVAKEIYELSDGRFAMDVCTYTRTHNKASVLCAKCGHVIEVTPNFLIGVLKENKERGCCYCSHTVTPSAHEVNEKIIKESKGKTHMIEATFINCSTYALMECDKGHQWWARPTAVYSSKTGCWTCTKQSMEKPVFDVLTEKKVDFDNEIGLKGCYYYRENMIQIHPLRADFKFKNYPIIIETDGRQHFIVTYGEDELKEIQERDEIKNKWCKEHGYILIRVTSSPTHEWGTERHITLKELLDLIEKYITEDGVVDIEAFRPYDFNRD